jgi:ribosome-binding protein aMBF1 (putative translation factor)
MYYIMEVQMRVKLKIAMLQKGIKGFDLAKHLDMDPAKVSKIINGWIEPDKETKRKINEYLGIRDDTWKE